MRNRRIKRKIRKVKMKRKRRRRIKIRRKRRRILSSHKLSQEAEAIVMFEKMNEENDRLELR